MLQHQSSGWQSNPCFIRCSSVFLWVWGHPLFLPQCSGLGSLRIFTIPVDFGSDSGTKWTKVRNHRHCNYLADVKSTYHGQLWQCDKTAMVPIVMQPISVPQCWIRFRFPQLLRFRIPTLNVILSSQTPFLLTSASPYDVAVALWNLLALASAIKITY